MADWRMVVRRGRYADALVFEDLAARRDLVRPHERRQGRAPLVRDTQLDVVSIRLEEVLRHRHERRWTVGVHRRRETGRPAEEEERSVAGDVIGMLVGD